MIHGRSAPPDKPFRLSRCSKAGQAHPCSCGPGIPSAGTEAFRLRDASASVYTNFFGLH